MYDIVTKSKKAEKQYYEFLYSRKDMPEKLERLRKDPRRELDAHKLKVKLCNIANSLIFYL